MLTEEDNRKWNRKFSKIRRFLHLPIFFYLLTITIYQSSILFNKHFKILRLGIPSQYGNRSTIIRIPEIFSLHLFSVDVFYGTYCYLSSILRKLAQTYLIVQLIIILKAPISKIKLYNWV